MLHRQIRAGTQEAQEAQERTKVLCFLCLLCSAFLLRPFTGVDDHCFAQPRVDLSNPSYSLAELGPPSVRIT